MPIFFITIVSIMEFCQSKFQKMLFKNYLNILKKKKEIEVDLEKQEITYGNKSVKFNLDSFKKKRLIEGLDNISLSMEKNLDIEKYENIMKKNKTWLTKND